MAAPSLDAPVHRSIHRFMRLVCQRKGFSWEDALPIRRHGQFHVTGRHTSRCVSPDYAAETAKVALER